MTYAGFWLRFVAYIIDGILLWIVNFAIQLGLTVILIEALEPLVLQVVISLLNLVIFLVYFALMESSAKQGTLGKMLIGIKVTDTEGGSISLGKAFGRNLGKIVSTVILLIGFIMAGFTEKKQALHDMMAGTLVVRK